MFYQKNLPLLERTLRTLLGLMLAAVALFLVLQPGRSTLSLWIAIGLLATGIFVAITGFIGWCPACALFGRKLKARQQTR